MIGLSQAGLDVHPLGQSEIGDLGSSVGRQEDVGRFEVAMHDPEPVHLMDGTGECFDQLGRVDCGPWDVANAIGQK